MKQEIEKENKTKVKGFEGDYDSGDDYQEGEIKEIDEIPIDPNQNIFDHTVFSHMTLEEKEEMAEKNSKFI